MQPGLEKQSEVAEIEAAAEAVVGIGAEVPEPAVACSYMGRDKYRVGHSSCRCDDVLHLWLSSSPKILRHHYNKKVLKRLKILKAL